MTNSDRDELVKLADHADEAATGHDQSGHVSSVSEVLRECATALRRLASSDGKVKGGPEPVAWPANLNPRTLALTAPGATTKSDGGGHDR